MYPCLDPHYTICFTVLLIQMYADQIIWLLDFITVPDYALGLICNPSHQS
jgi:hypothetical protein